MNRKILRFTLSFGVFLFSGYLNAQSIKSDIRSDDNVVIINNSAESGVTVNEFHTEKLQKNSKVLNPQKNNTESSTSVKVTSDSKNIRLKHKIIPLSNSVYQLIDYFEAKGITGFLPMAKPYTKEYIAQLLLNLSKNEHLKEWEKNRIQEYLADITNTTNGLAIIQKEDKNTYTLGGFSAETSVRNGMGDDGTWSTSLIGEPYLSGDLGEHITYTAAMGLSVERLTPDLFYQSYTKNSQVEFPNQSIGYSYLPYQFNFETMWAHVKADASSGEGGPVKDNLTAGMIYHTELNSSWLDGKVQIGINNQRRAWGHDQSNLVLSNTARRFPGIELKIHPAKWIRYSYLTGSLFSYANQRSSYRKDIYGYDLGQVQKNFTYHLLEIMPTNWLQISGGGGNVWSKRLEIAYLMPFVYPQFTQIDVGDHDNLTLYFDVATQIPVIGKTWLGFFVDEFSFTKGGSLLKMPRNRYAWQLGWRTNLISGIIPGTTSTLKYTRLTPFVYTHYPETDFNTFGSDRPLDMTYTHDEFNLGFYLPPNSGEINWKLENIAVKDLTLSLENRLIIHGTNDLASSNIYQIYGDVYRHQLEGPDNDIYEYPLLNFTKDGIYDWTAMSEFKFDWKIRKSGLLNYYRLVGSLGYSNTWWKSNESGVVAPESKSLFTGSLGIVVEM